MAINQSGIGGFQFDVASNYRDVFWAGSCDDGCMELAALLGWDQELKDLIDKEHRVLDAVEDGGGGGGEGGGGGGGSASQETAESITNSA